MGPGRRRGRRAPVRTTMPGARPPGVSWTAPAVRKSFSMSITSSAVFEGVIFEPGSSRRFGVSTERRPQSIQEASKMPSTWTTVSFTPLVLKNCAIWAAGASAAPPICFLFSAAP